MFESITSPGRVIEGRQTFVGVTGSMKALKVIAVVMVLLVMAAPLLADTAKPSDADKTSVAAPSGVPNYLLLSGAGIGAGLGAGLTIIGAGLGFGKIGSSALESMARQPEVAGRILPAMIVIAALLEGAALFAVFVCFTVAGKAGF
jgi:F-type H+-transporting ATPase subunit c